MFLSGPGSFKPEYGYAVKRFQPVCFAVGFQRSVHNSVLRTFTISTTSRGAHAQDITSLEIEGALARQSGLDTTPDQQIFSLFACFPPT
jgi:hypothetical protein